MKTLDHYLEKGIDFETYLQQVQQAVSEKQEMWEYSELNLARMNRIQKTHKLTENQLEKLQKVQPISLLIISESWCGDASQILPIVVSIAKSANWNYSIVYRDENPVLMNNYLTNGAKAIPIIIGIKNNQEIFRFGPRTQAGFKLLMKYKNNPEEYTKDQFHKDLQQYYNHNKGNDIFEEILALVTHENDSLKI